MPVHEFRSNLAPPSLVDGTPEASPLGNVSAQQEGELLLPLDLPKSQYAHERIQDFMPKGYEALDEAMKNYFSDIRIPNGDQYRFLRVKIAGGDRSVQVWRNELDNGHTRLPVAAIDRTSEQHNPDKFSLPYLPMKVRYLNPQRSRAAKVFRPAPFLVEYAILVWGEHKTDMEAIHAQIATRFTSGMAEFHMSDGHLQGNVQLLYGGMTDSTDKESTGQDQHTYRRYEYKLTAEAWLPLPEVHMNTILGSVQVLREQEGIGYINRSGFSNEF